MHFFRNIPLIRKLTLVSMLTSSVAIVLTCAVIGTYELFTFRRELVQQAELTARMIGDNSTAALTFDDPSSAELTLRSLGADEHVVAACIYDDKGQPFSTYRAAKASPPPPPVEHNIHRFSDDYLELFTDGFADDALELFQDISVAGEKIGTIYLRYNMLGLRDRLRHSITLLLCVTAVASLVAFLLTRKLQPLVAGPILDLARVVREVATQQDFSVRATKHGEDEIGRLIDGFNEMLSQIQQRDHALQKAQDELERRVVERTAELASSLSVLNATLDSTADGIFAVELSGRVLSYNTKFATMWSIPPEMLKRGDRPEMLRFVGGQVKDPDRFFQRVHEIDEDLPAPAFDIIELKDGRTFERYVQPQLSNGKRVGMVFNFRDVTARKLAERKLEDAHKQLLETSRQAGMAEVATGVLHNVGNVLNSVNISASLATENLRKSKVANLGRVIALLDEHAADLGTFVTSDPQGRKLASYLRQLHQRLTEEQRTVLLEVESLRQNIEHIKDIVAMQQEYARVSGVTEVLQVTDLVEDSLRMNAAALSRHGVMVERDYHDTPLVALERHKTLQILINLIRNAKYACDEGGRDEKRLIVRVRNGGGRVRISVSDNGVGIPPENLARIFNHGFTTRKEGHGFGLHSGAIAATEMGGTLHAHSDGLGHGATFTLELPADGTAS